MLVSGIYFSFQNYNPFNGIPSIFVEITGENINSSYNNNGILVEHQDGYNPVSLSPEQIVVKILSLIPRFNDKDEYNFVRSHGRDTHLVFCGGEPLLYSQEILDILEMLEEEDIFNIVFETNGSQKISEDLQEFLKHSRYIPIFKVFPKLSKSGVPWAKAIRPSVIEDFNELFYSHVHFYYAISEEQDILEVKRAIDRLGIHDGVSLISIGNDKYVNECVQKISLKNQFNYNPHVQYAIITTDNDVELLQEIFTDYVN